MGAGHGIGIKRNDYHRPNRLENKSTHCYSHGRNVGGTDPLDVPLFERDDLIRNASAWAGTRPGSLERMCVKFLLHRMYSDSRYSELRALEAIVHAYPWLAAECDEQDREHRRKIRVHRRIGAGDLTRLQIKEQNELQPAPVEPHTEEDEVPIFFESLTSLNQTRFLYLPPFLKPNEIRARRFGGQLEMNDRWWEWEKEKGVTSTEGRPRLDMDVR